MAARFAPARVPRHFGRVLLPLFHLHARPVKVRFGQFRSPAVRFAAELPRSRYSRPSHEKPRLSLLQGGGDGVQTAAGLEVMGRGYYGANRDLSDQILIKYGFGA